MKLTAPLSLHNLYRMMQNQWKVARKRRVTETPALRQCRKNNLEVLDPNDFVAPPRKEDFDFSTVVGLAPKEVVKDKNHPLYKEHPCYVYRDSSVLLEGLHQALVLTNTIQLQPNTLPVQIDTLLDSVQLPNQDELVKRCIRTSCLYDAEQKKLPVKKDPTRPAWNFPRDYGITQSRKNRLLCNRLVHLCALASPDTSANRVVLSNVPMSVPFQLGDDPVQFELRSDIFLTSNKPLTPLIDLNETDGQPLPELVVSHPLVSLEEDHFYELKDVFPLKEGSRYSKVHTIIIHYNDTEVRNRFDTPVTLTQVEGRSLLKAYTAAVAQARYDYGPDVKDLPEPVVVQCVQTDGTRFHFSILQLNSADVTSSQRNVFWILPPLQLYEYCSYDQAIPILQGYNPEVFKHLLAFYLNNP